MFGAMGKAAWDFMPLEGSSDRTIELITLFSKFSREMYGIKPPFIPTLEGQTFDQFKEALSSPQAENFLKKIVAQWNKGQ